MSDTPSVAPVAPTMAPVEEIQKGWPELHLKVAELEAARAALEHQLKATRQLLEVVVEHRHKSHSELVMLLTNLVSKLPLNDVGGLIAQLLEHDTRVKEFLGGVGKGKVPTEVVRPDIIKSLDHAKRDLADMVKQQVDELLRMDTCIEKETLCGLAENPGSFYSPRTVRANRCFVKGHLPKERVLREFGPEALVFFNDMTTDAKLNPRPKQDEILLAFKSDLESLLAEAANLPAEKKQALQTLYQKVWRSKASGEEGRVQRSTFLRLSFAIELLHFYEHQATESPDVVFAQRLPALVEQIAVQRPDDYLALDENAVTQAESLLNHILSPNHRHAVINNLSKGSPAANTLKFVLKFRSEKLEELDHSAAEFIRHLIPAPPQRPPGVDALTTILKTLPPDAQRLVVNGILHTDRMRRTDAEAFAKALGEKLGLKSIAPKAAELPPEVERQLAWDKIKDLILRRTEASAVATAIRERLHARYDADEIKQSWITLTEAEPILFIRVFCHLPYLADGRTDPIARTILDTYVTRLMHEKYATVYNKVVRSLKNMYHAKPDSPTLLNFVALVRWVNPEAADKLSVQIGMPAATMQHA